MDGVLVWLTIHLAEDKYVSKTTDTVSRSTMRVGSDCAGGHPDVAGGSWPWWQREWFRKRSVN